jgi:2,4-dienoyl-CoA reductase-like NADH-dependent reductase (Old Yellow Enzyme family)
MPLKKIQNKTLADAFREKRLGQSGLLLKNSFIKSATFEGMYDQGIPNQNLIDHHRRIAMGNVAMTTVSYGAVSKEARTFSDQMYIHPGSLKPLKELARKVHEVGGKVAMQLTHCGYFSKNKSANQLLAPSRLFNAYGALSGLMFSKAMTLKDMEQVAHDFAQAAVSLQSIGFDALEIHMGHGYLLSQFLNPKTNRRKDLYGGSIENRSRFPLEVLKKVVAAVGSDFPVLAKLNLSDGIKGGFSIEDCVYVSKLLEKNGCSAIVLSGGFTSKTPFYMMRGKVPLKGMIKNGNSLAEKITLGLFGPLIIKKYDYASHFFLPQAKQVRRTVDMDLVYLGGADSKDAMEKILNSGFDFIALARPLIHDPAFLKKLESGLIEKSLCNHCNECIVEMDRGGISCVLESSAV